MGIVYDEDDVLIPPGVRALHRSTPGTLQPAPSATQPTAAAGPSVATPSGDADVVLVSPTFPTAPHVKPGETPQPAPPAAPSPAPQLPPNAQPPPSGGPGLGSPPNRGGATKHPTQPTPANGGGDKTGRVIARVDPPFGARPPISSSVARERYAFDYLRDELGLTSVQAAALVGNLSYESTAFLRAGPPRLVPSLGEVGGTGIGIAQWTYPPRKQALFAFAKKAGKPWTDFQLQLDYVVEEMRTTYAYALSRLRGARNLADATAIVENYYESPQPGSTPQRLYYARRVLSESR